MNKENLLAAFGEIDEEFFEERLSNISGKGEEAAVEPVFVTGRRKRNKKPLIIAASAAAACGVFVAGLGISRSNNVDHPQVTTYDSSTIFPNIEFADDYKTMYNAKDLYQVKTIEVDPDIANKYHDTPSIVNGDKVYFVTNIAPLEAYEKTEQPKTADIIEYDTVTGREETVYSCRKSREEATVSLELLGIYNSCLYFTEKETTDKETTVSLCMAALSGSDKTEVIFSRKSGFFTRFVLSKSDNCIYFNYTEGNIIDNDNVTKLYRYDIQKDKAVIFMEDAYAWSPYKNGIIYRKGESFYCHDSANPDSDVLIENHRVIDSYGGDFYLYSDIHIENDESDDRTIDTGISDENADKHLLTAKDIFSSLTQGTSDGIVLFEGLPGRDKPLIYDYKKDIFSFIDVDPGGYNIFSPLGFNISESIGVITHHAENSQYESVTITTVTRRRERGVLYNSSDIFPDMEFAEKYKTMYNAEDLYDVNKMEIDWEMIEKYQYPQLADGDKVYFTTRIDPLYYYTNTLKTDPPKTADIILYDNTLNEERVIYSCGKQIEDTELVIDLAGIYDGWLYFYKGEYREHEEYSYLDFCRVNLTDLSSQVIFTRQNSDYLSPVLSKGENCLYLTYDEYDDEGPLPFPNGVNGGINKHSTRRTYRYDINSGETELFGEDVTMYYPYKKGILYSKDDNLYFHSSNDSEDVILCPDNYAQKQAFGGDFFLYLKGGKEITDSRALGIYGENGERELIYKTDMYLHSDGSQDGLVGFTTGDKPLIYDYKSDMFSFIDEGIEDGKYTTAFSPLGFAGSEGTAFLQCVNESVDRTLVTTRAWVVTVTRKPAQSDNDIVTEKQEENPLSSYELYTDGNSGEILNAEDLYHVNKEELYRRIDTLDSLAPFESMGALESIYSNRFYGGGRVYLEGTDFYFTTEKSGKTPDKPDYEKTPAQILLYDTQHQGGITVIAEEMPEEEEWGLMLKIAGIFDGYMYYYKIERPEGYAEEPSINSLWRVNLQDGEKEKISDIKYDYYLDLDPVVKGGDYIWFTDYGVTSGADGGDNSRIYRFNTKTRETEIFMEQAKSPLLCSYKDGVIYYSLGNYFLYWENGETKTLCPKDYTGKINAFGADNIMYAHRIWENNEQKTVLGIFGENLVKRDLGIFPTGEKITPETQISFFGAGAVNKSFATGNDNGLVYVSIQFGNNILLYDKDKDCFSQIVLSEDQEVICCSETEEGLAFIIAETEVINGVRSRDYKSVSCYTVSR